MRPARLDTHHGELLAQVERALEELSVMSATLRDLADGNQADRVSISPRGLRNYFHFQQERSDGALQLLRGVMYAPLTPNNPCRVV